MTLVSKVAKIFSSIVLCSYFYYKEQFLIHPLLLRTTKKQKFIFRHRVIPTTTSQRRFENLFLRKDGGGDRDSCIGRPLLEPTHYLSTDVIGYR